MRSGRQFLGEEESELELPRTKPRLQWLRLGYRVVPLAKFLLGAERLLRLCLNGAWMLRRLAFEIAGDVYGEPLYAATGGVSETLLREWIPERAGVLDLGCGTGRLSRLLGSCGHRVLAIDRDTAKIETARRAPASPNVTFVVGDVTKSLVGQIGGARFDVALLVHLLEHLDEPESLLRELLGFAEWLVVEVPDFEADPLNRLRLSLDAPFFSDADHVREYTARMLQEQLDRSGWRLLQHRLRNGAIVALAARRVAR